jgi:hypothetical protein
MPPASLGPVAGDLKLACVRARRVCLEASLHHRQLLGYSRQSFGTRPADVSVSDHLLCLKKLWDTMDVSPGAGGKRGQHTGCAHTKGGQIGEVHYSTRGLTSSIKAMILDFAPLFISNFLN